MPLSQADAAYIEQWAKGDRITSIPSTVSPNPNKGIFGQYADDTGQAGQASGNFRLKPKQPKPRPNDQLFKTAGPVGESDLDRENRVRKAYNLPPRKS